MHASKQPIINNSINVGSSKQATAGEKRRHQMIKYLEIKPSY
jgi:hypothetical protein